MRDSAPRLVKKSRPVVSHSQTCAPQTPKRRAAQRAQRALDHHGLKRLSKLRKFQEKINRLPDALARQTEILPYFSAMLASGRIRCRPVKPLHLAWIYRQTDRDLVARELFRLAYSQHCASVDWPPVVSA